MTAPLDAVTEPGDTMRALVAADGDPAGLRVTSVPPPVPGPGYVLVAVHAAAVTPGELEWPETWPTIPAHDVSGIVVALGADVDDVAVGDEVFALIAFDRPGAAAQFACVAAADVAHKPASVEHVAAAALPLGALTAWQALFDHAHLEKGGRVLVHGGAGGVGSYAVSLAARHGATVAATASARDLDDVRALGAETVVDYTTRFEDVIAPVDVVVDTVGGRVTERSWPLLRPGGILVGVAEEPPDPPAARDDVRAVYFVVEPNRAQLAEIARLTDAGQMRPAVGRVLPLSDAVAGFDERSSGSHASGRTVILTRATDADREESA